jgi:hypothetical protein
MKSKSIEDRIPSRELKHVLEAIAPVRDKSIIHLEISSGCPRLFLNMNRVRKPTNAIITELIMAIAFSVLFVLIFIF